MDSYLVTATKEFKWDMAHMLSGHKGLCRNLHGHTYKMEVTACRLNGLVNTIEESPENGMVVDFKGLSEIVKSLIVEPLDHATMVDVNSTDLFEQELIQLLSKYSKKHVSVNYRPTAENMAIHFLDTINNELVKIDAQYRVVKIRLFETPTSYAEIVS
ncbi:MAG: 6-carboxytetrahydropterin synthase [Cellulosilyticaceae bacterium]